MNDTMNDLQVRTLGRFELSFGDVVISENNRHSSILWDLLAYLVTNRNRQVSHSELIDNLWSDDTSANPLSSLKTALARLRKHLQPISTLTGELIITTRGAYQFNPNIGLSIDVDIFEREQHAGFDETIPVNERIQHLMNATQLYEGDYLPLHKEELWISPLATAFKMTFNKINLELFRLLEEQKEYDAMKQAITHALEIDSLEEAYHCQLIELLMMQGNSKEALAHCRYTQDLLYKNLRVQSSPRLTALFNQLFKEHHSLGISNEGIIKNLNSSMKNKGAFYCDYGIFEEIYRLESRRCLRTGNLCQLCIVTLQQSNHIPPLDTLTLTMPWLLDSISQCLRSGDVVTKVSGAQYILLLPMADRQNAERIVERIRENYYKNHRKSLLHIDSYFYDITDKSLHS